MENSLFDYMNRRISGIAEKLLPPGEAGPVITLSRQSGCGASRIAWALCEELNKKKPAADSSHKWKLISREILLSVAEKLNLDPQALRHVINDKDRGIMDQIVEALSSHSVKSDGKILKTLREVIRQFGNNGRVVIVGRGGASLCSGIENSLHIRLEAPLDWRMAQIEERLGFSREYARDYIRERDAERERFIKKVAGRGKAEPAFDVVLNRSRMTEKQLVQIILHLAAVKGLINTK
jgi:cytidylate kinase